MSQIPTAEKAPLTGPQIKTLSKSGLTTFEKCPMAYQFGYLQHKWLPASYSMILGTAFHFAAEVNFDHKKDKGDDLNLSYLENVFESKWKDEVKKRMADVARTGWDPDGKKEVPEDPQRIFDDGIRLVGIFREQVAPRIQPILNEVKFEVQVPGMPQGYRLKGVIDLVCLEILDWQKMKFGKRPAIFDYKSKRNPRVAPLPGAAATMHDPKLYAAGYQAVKGHLPAQTGIISVFRRELKTKTDEGVVFDPWVPDQEAVDRAVFRVRAAFKAIHAEAFCGASAMINESMGCSPEGCGHWSYCPAHL